MPQPTQTYKGVIRWQSAKVILDVVKTPLPKEFTNYYVISVGGIPVNAGQQGRYQSTEDSSQSNEYLLDRIKNLTFLEPKDKRDLQPGIVVQRPITATCISVSPRSWLRCAQKTKQRHSPRASAGSR